MIKMVGQHIPYLIRKSNLSKLANVLEEEPPRQEMRDISQLFLVEQCSVMTLAMKRILIKARKKNAKCNEEEQVSIFLTFLLMQQIKPTDTPAFLPIFYTTLFPSPNFFKKSISEDSYGLAVT